MSKGREDWAKHSRRHRPSIAATLPALCVNGCGGLVYANQNWHVGHIIDHARGGSNERSNLGPAHAKCNLRDGGKLGAAITNAKKRRRVRAFPEW